jgi:ABC-2 type transport system permease protein
MRRAITVEMLKFRRSPVVLVATVLIVVLVPLLCLGFLAAANGNAVGAIAAKARAMGIGEGWDGYLDLLAQIAAVTLFIGPGVVVAWTFGREHADRTFPSLFALPVSRRCVAAAKFLVLLGWSAALTTLLLAAATVAGIAAGVGPLEGNSVVTTLARIWVAGLLTTIIALTLGYVASIGRGYLPAIGALILLTMFAQVAVALGTGAWFPYAAPGLYAVAGAEGVTDVTPLQLLLVPVATLAVAWATVHWWGHAEVTS